MRDDLLDAQAALDWAETQIQRFNEALTAWEAKYPYGIIKESDPDSDGYLVVAIQNEPFPLTFNAWVGAIINSLRSSLDLLAAALATRNGMRPDSNRHFPIFGSEGDMIEPIGRGLHSTESKKWLSAAEIATIKSLKPYKGGDHALWPLHQLDILRKHERLITGRPVINGVVLLGGARQTVWGARPVEGRNDKTVLARLTRSENFPVSKGNVFVALDVRFQEAALGLPDTQVIPTIRGFAFRVREIINLFNN